MDPSDWEVSCRIGIVYSELGVVSYSKECFTESEAHFTSAITHNPKVSRFYTCRAKARLMRKVRLCLITLYLKHVFMVCHGFLLSCPVLSLVGIVPLVHTSAEM